MSLDLFTFGNLARVPGITHAVTTRQGGVSDGRYASLNVSFTVDDEPAHVEENLTRIATAVGTERSSLFSPYQVHGNASTLVDESTPERPCCDILLTTSPARTLLLRYADCTPILLADLKQHAIAAAHAGWRGTALRTASTAVRAMAEAFGSAPADLVVGIGPAIGPCCYQVGPEVVSEFADRDWAINRSAGDTKLDLWEANRRDLVEAGVPESQIELAGICTQCQSDQFFSHRANGGQNAGRFAAVIRLTA